VFRVVDSIVATCSFYRDREPSRSTERTAGRQRVGPCKQAPLGRAFTHSELGTVGTTSLSSPAPLAAEGDEEVAPALPATGPCKAAGEDAMLEVAAERSLDFAGSRIGGVLLGAIEREPGPRSEGESRYVS